MARAPRMSLGNLTSFETMTAQFNPAELERTVSVNYERLGILGHSSELLQYKFRANEKLSFLLRFDKHSTDKGSAMEAERLLDAMTLGSRAAQDIASGGPPDVLMLWPGVLTMRVRIMTLKYNYNRFASTDGTPTLFAVQVDVEEARTNRLFSEDVRQNGIDRGGG